MKFSLLINMKMPTIVGIFILISREIFIIGSTMFSKKKIATISNLRFISRTKFYNLGGGGGGCLGDEAILMSTHSIQFHDKIRTFY